MDRLPVGAPDGVFDSYKITGQGELNLEDMGIGEGADGSASGSKVTCSGFTVGIALVLGPSGQAVLTVIPAEGTLVAEVNAAPLGPEGAPGSDIDLRAVAAELIVHCAVPIPDTGLQLNDFRGGFRMDRDLDLLQLTAGLDVETELTVPLLDAPFVEGPVDMTLQVMPNPSIFMTGTVPVMKFFQTHEATLGVEFHPSGMPKGVRGQIVVWNQPWQWPYIPMRGTAGFHAWTDWDPITFAEPELSDFHFTGWGYIDVGLEKGQIFDECVDVGLFDVCLTMPPSELWLTGVGVEFGEFCAKDGSIWGLKGKVYVLKLYEAGMFIGQNGVDFTDVDAYVLLDSGQVMLARQAWPDAQRGHSRAIAAMPQYDLFTFAPQTITRTVPIAATTDVVFMLSRSSSVPMLTLVSPSEVEITPETTLENVGHYETVTTTVDADGHTVTITQTTYVVGQAEAGDWQMVLRGDITAEDEYVLGVIGSNPAPVLTDVSAVSTGPTDADVGWSLASDEITTTLNIYATSGPITATLVITTGEGTTETVTVPVYGGWRVAEDVRTPLNGAPASASVDLGDLASGPHWIWVEADDGRNTPLRVYAPDPVMVDQSGSWPLTWTPAITVTPGYHTLHIAWEHLDHPDADGYAVYVSDASGAGPGPISNAWAITTPWLSTFTPTWLEPGRTYYASIVAFDADSGRTVRSREVEGVPRAAEFELTTPTPVVTITGGSATAVDVLVVRTGDVTPTIGLYAGALPDGLDVIFTGSRWVTPTLAGTPVSLVISATDTMPGGIYAATIAAFGGGRLATLEIQVEVDEPYFRLAATPGTATLRKDQSAAVTISATGFNGESDPINLELSGAPPGLLWSLSSDVVHPGGSTTLVITDTFLVDHGQYTLHLIGDDGENEYDLVVPLDVIKPGFSLAPVEPRYWVLIGETAVLVLEVNAGHGWTDPVTLTLDAATLPPDSMGGLAGNPSDSPQPQIRVTPSRTAYVIVDTGSATPEDVYLLTVDAEGGTWRKSLDLELWVLATLPPPVTFYQVRFHEAAYSAVENDGLAPITVTLDTVNAFQDVTVAYATADGTATAGEDYIAVSSVVTIPAGSLIAAFNVPIIEDTADEPSETILLSLSSPGGATLGSPNHATLTIVGNVAPTVGLPTVTPSPSEEGSAVTASATFSDPGSDEAPFDCTLNYGDDSGDQAGIVSGNTCSGDHVYADNGTYSVTVSVTDKGGGTGTSPATSHVVNNVAPEITATGDTIEENGVATVSGTITDPGTQDAFTVVINWGEGSPQTYDYPAGTTSYSEQHQYLDDNPSGTPSDVYPISVNVTDDDGGVGTASASIEVNNVPLSVGPINAPTEPVVVGTEVTASASFSDAGLLDTHTAVWDWGDGASTPATLTQGAGSGSVKDHHTYMRSGRFTIRLTVTDDDGGEGSATHTLIVYSPSQAIESVVDEVESLDLPHGLKTH